jgi:hypothetical protein
MMQTIINESTPAMLRHAIMRKFALLVKEKGWEYYLESKIKDDAVYFAPPALHKEFWAHPNVVFLESLSESSGGDDSIFYGFTKGVGLLSLEITLD